MTHVPRSRRIPTAAVLRIALLAVGLSTPFACTTPGTDLSRPEGDRDIAGRSEDSAPPPTIDNLIMLPGGIVVDRSAPEVRVPASTAIDVGWLEQVVCSRNTRDHEALFVVDVPPSAVHAALLLIGLEPGSPGRWAFEEIEGTANVVVRRIPPVGDQVDIRVRYQSGDGTLRDHPVADWIVGDGGMREFPVVPWVFGGSFLSGPAGAAAYAADRSGSLVGLVTFGDEVLGLESVLSDQLSVDAAEWEVRTSAVLAPGTEVVLVFSPATGG